jgi:thioredoxin-like negative regulator of GroEL
LPSINALQAESGADGLVVLLVDIAESRETVARVAATRGYTARVLLDPDGRVTEAYQVRATPTVYLVARDGTLIARAVGPRPWTQEPGRALLAALLKPEASSRR